MKCTLLALLLVGCGTPLTYSEFRQQLAKTWCATALAAGALPTADAASCDPSPWLAIIEQSAIDPVAGVASGHLRFDRNRAADCLDVAAHTPLLAGPGLLLAQSRCHDVLAPATPLGGTCRGVGECLHGACVDPTTGSPCTGPTSCVYCPSQQMGFPPQPCMDTGAVACVGTCQPPAALQAPCGVGCDSLEGYCGFPNCAPWLREGVSCAVGACAPGLYCAADPGATNSSTAICRAIVVARKGEPCALPTTQCEPGSYCAGTCVPQLPDGATCDSRDACRVGLTCRGLIESPAQPGTCSRVAQLGEACTPISSGSGIDDGCAETLLCVGASCSRFQGTPAPPPGPCASGACTFKPGVTGACTKDEDCGPVRNPLGGSRLSCVQGRCEAPPTCKVGTPRG